MDGSLEPMAWSSVESSGLNSAACGSYSATEVLLETAASCQKHMLI